jgi:hypothetical protein
VKRERMFRVLSCECDATQRVSPGRERHANRHSKFGFRLQDLLSCSWDYPPAWCLIESRVTRIAYVDDESSSLKPYFKTA